MTFTGDWAHFVDRSACPHSLAGPGTKAYDRSKGMQARLDNARRLLELHNATRSVRFLDDRDCQEQGHTWCTATLCTFH